MTNALLSVTASNTNKIYGQTITFAGTEFTVSGLLSTDHVASVTLSSPGAVATAGVAGSPYTIDITNALGDDGLTNYLISYLPGTLTLSKADPIVTVTPYSVTYDGAAHTATGTAKGVLNENLSGLLLTGTTHTAAGTYTADPWTFTDSTGNYNNTAGSVNDAIAKANPTIVVTPYSVTYDGAAHTATGTAKGVLNENLSGLLLTGTTHTAAGTYTADPWTFTDSTGNYNNAAGSVNDAIAKANPTIVVTPYSVTYDGAAHTATGTAKGVLNENLSGLVLTGTTHTAAGTYTADPWTFTDSTGNYNNTAGSVNDAIATAALTVTPDDATRGYGKTNPVFTVSYNGFVNNEGSGVLGGTLAVSSVADTNSPHRHLSHHRQWTHQRQLPDQLPPRHLDRDQRLAERHRQRHQQDLRPDDHLRRNRVHRQRPAQHRPCRQCHSEQRRSRGNGRRGGLALHHRHHQRPGRRRPDQLPHLLPARHLDPEQGRPHRHRHSLQRDL